MKSHAANQIGCIYVDVTELVEDIEMMTGEPVDLCSLAAKMRCQLVHDEPGVGSENLPDGSNRDRVSAAGANDLVIRLERSAWQDVLDRLAAGT